MCVFLVRTDIGSRKAAPRAEIVFVATRVDSFNNLVSSGDGRCIDDHITQYAHVVGCAMMRGVLFKLKADSVGASQG